MAVTVEIDPHWEPAVRCGFVDEADRVTAHNVRVPDGRWARFGVVVKRLSHTRTGVLNQFIAWYVREPGARLPQRPGEGD